MNAGFGPLKGNHTGWIPSFITEQQRGGKPGKASCPRRISSFGKHELLDHAPLVGSASISVKIAVHNVAVILPQSRPSWQSAPCLRWHTPCPWKLCCRPMRRDSVPHISGRAVVPLPATPHGALRSIDAERASRGPPASRP